MTLCWKCGTDISDYPNKIPFKATCDRCHSWLHVCRNCKHYCPGKPNDCLIPRTELIADREKLNFCEEFTVLGKGPEASNDATDVEKRLFGEDIDKPKSKGADRFRDLFGE